MWILLLIITVNIILYIILTKLNIEYKGVLTLKIFGVIPVVGTTLLLSLIAEELLKTK